MAAGYRAAQLAALGILASLRKELGSLNRVGRVVKVLGAVNCTPEFTQQPAVINGCSELLAEVFGREAGIGARSAIGVGSLPLGVAGRDRSDLRDMSAATSSSRCQLRVGPPRLGLSASPLHSRGTAERPEPALRRERRNEQIRLHLQ